MSYSRTVRISPLIALLVLGLAACRPSDAAFADRGGAESLLDVSTEVVNLPIAQSAERQQLSDWIAQDQPSRAELYCVQGEASCTETQKLLELHGVSVAVFPSHDQTVALVYERILARDCTQRYRDNASNLFNAHHASFGCSVAANMVQHVSDKQQFVQPSVMDASPASAAVAAYARASAAKPPSAAAPDVNHSILDSIGKD